MRGQAHTVEAFAAAVLVVSGLVFATQAAAVTPLSASTSNQHIENQQEATVEGLLAASADNGDLTEAVLDWDPDEEAFVDTKSSETYYSSAPLNPFGDALRETLSSRQTAFNVVIRFPDGDRTSTQRMVWMGQPTDNAVSATRTVGLYDGSQLPVDGDPTLAEVEDDPTAAFYTPDTDPDSQLYAVVEVEVIVWRK